MKWLAMSFVATFFVCTISVKGLGQTDQSKSLDSNEKWIRVESDDGEFSIEVPDKYHFFSNNGGFSVSRNGNHDNYFLKQARLLKSFLNGTLVSFECYEADKSALKALVDGDSFPKARIVKSEIKKDNFTIKQSIHSSERSYMIYQYFYSKKNIYVLAAASRNGETAFMRRFLDSLIFSPNDRIDGRKDTVKFSALTASEPDIAFDFDQQYPPKKTTKSKDSQKDVDDQPFTLLYRAHPAFTDSARQNEVTGIVVVRATFSAEGHVSKIIVLRQLPEGLVRQVLFATVRMIFLPKEIRGKPESLAKFIEYSFATY